MKANTMEKITSFTINHLKLLPGVYVSRLDDFDGSKITTIDIRMTRPNFEPVLNTAEIHTIEHLGATFLRNHPQYGNKIIYFGPMGCRTGFYLLITGAYSSEDVLPLIKEMIEFICAYEGEIPGANALDCGNFRDMNLPMAKYAAQKFQKNVLENINVHHLNYPD